MSMDFIPIRLNTLRPDATLNFDVYIQVGSRLLHYLRTNDPFDQSRLESLKKKGVRKLFISTPSENNYLDYLEAGLNTLKDSGKSVAEKGSLAHDSMVTAAENVERSLDSEQGMKRTEAQFTKVTEFLMSNRTAIKSMMDTAGSAKDDPHHAANVSSLSLSVAMGAKITDSKDLLELGIACLVHDLGRTKLTFDSMKPRSEMTPAERKEYEKHTEYTVQMLAGKKLITPRILGMCASHEEIGEGRGFPEKKNFRKLPEVYQVLNLCNDFDRFCFENKTEEGQTASQMVDPFFEKRGELFGDELVSILATTLT